MNKQEEMAKQLLNLASKNNSLDKMGQIIQGLQQMDGALRGLYQQQYAIAVNMDAMKLTIQALIFKLLEKGTFTKEEWEKIYEEKVAEVMKEMLDKHNQEELEEESKEELREASVDSREEMEPVASNTEISDIALASEINQPISFG